jgi:hypothetical protein
LIVGSSSKRLIELQVLSKTGVIEYVDLILLFKTQKACADTPNSALRYSSLFSCKDRTLTYRSVTASVLFQVRLENLRKETNFLNGAYLFNTPRIPPTIPKIIPAKNPPPMIKLKTANGNMIMAASAPFDRIITMEPMIITRPMMSPKTNA